MTILLAVAILMIPVAAMTTLGCHIWWERRRERRRRGPIVLARYEPVASDISL